MHFCGGPARTHPTKKTKGNSLGSDQLPLPPCIPTLPILLAFGVWFTFISRKVESLAAVWTLSEGLTQSTRRPTLSFLPSSRTYLVCSILPAQGFQSVPVCCHHIYIPQSKTSACGSRTLSERLTATTRCLGFFPCSLPLPYVLIIAHLFIVVKGFFYIFYFYSWLF